MINEILEKKSLKGEASHIIKIEKWLTLNFFSLWIINSTKKLFGAIEFDRSKMSLIVAAAA